MKVGKYEFGKILIDGSSFDSDILILSDRVMDQWRRTEGHTLHAGDLGVVIDDHPRLLIVGTGMFGMMKVPGTTKAFLRSRGVEMVAMKTKAACRLFNEKQDEGGVAAALHLTC